MGGLDGDDHPQYALLAGRSSGQTLIGGTASGENLTLQSTAHATKGKILFGTSGYDEVNNRLGIGTNAPEDILHVNSGTSNAGILIKSTTDNARLELNSPTDEATSIYMTTGATPDAKVNIFRPANSDDLRIQMGGTQSFALTSAGNMGVGDFTDPATLLELSKDSADTEFTISTFHDTEATTPKLIMRKGDNTRASPALVDDNAVLGTLSFQGYDGSGWHEGARIEARIDGAPSDGTDMPTELAFWTTADGSGSPTERMTIGPTGLVTIATDLTVNNDFVIDAGTIAFSGNVIAAAAAGDTDVEFISGNGAEGGAGVDGGGGSNQLFRAGSGGSGGVTADGGDGGNLQFNSGGAGLGGGAGGSAGAEGVILFQNASGLNVGIGFGLSTATVTEKLTVKGNIWVTDDSDKFLAGAGKDGEIYVASDHFHIHNVTEDMDLVFGIDDGGVSKTITWDADVDKLKHSAGLFDFDNDHLATSGYGQFGYASIGTGVSPVGTTYLTIGDLTTSGFDAGMDVSILMSTDSAAKYALKFSALNDYELWGASTSQGVLFTVGYDVNPYTASTLDVQRNLLQGAGVPGDGTVITAGTHTWRALRLIANNADVTNFPTGGTFNIRPLEIDAPPDRYDGGTTVLNWTGIYINNATTNSPDTAWSIYSNGGDSYHKGDIAFGQTDKAERIGSDADGTLDLYAGTSIELHDATNIGDGTNELQISATGNVLLPAGAADAGRYPIKFQAGTALATPEAGVIEFNGGKFCITNVATCRVIDRTSDVIVSTKTVTATAVETEIWRGTMPANSLVAGNMFKFHADGVVTNDVATKDDITLRIYIGTIGDPGDAIVTLTPNTKALDGADWHVNGNACQRTIGAAGSRAFHIHMKIGDPTAEGAEVFASGLGTVNTEIGLDIIVTVQWETDDVDNTISLYQGFLEYKN